MLVPRPSPTKLFVAWQEPKSRRWLPVGVLDSKGGAYSFRYTRGALHSSEFVPFAGMSNLGTTYQSTELFPLFANRLLSASRPEYREFITWMDLGQPPWQPLEILARSGGTRATDSLEIFPEPLRTHDNHLETYFFAHGMSHMAAGAAERVGALNVGDKLFLLKDFQNPHHGAALAIRTGDPQAMVGYCPRYLVDDVGPLCDKHHERPVNLTVAKVNLAAPIQFRLLCKFDCEWFDDCYPMSGIEYQPIETKSYRFVSAGDGRTRIPATVEEYVSVHPEDWSVAIETANHASSGHPLELLFENFASRLPPELIRDIYLQRHEPGSVDENRMRDALAGLAAKGIMPKAYIH